jgi:prolycopene isomerase
MDQPRDIPRSCDVVVIGAGVGGLVAAALLARGGLEVAVLEGAGKPGGYLAGFQRNGFAFDTAIHWLNQCGPGGMVHRVLDRVGDDVPQTPPMSRIRRYRGRGFDYLLTSEPDELRETLTRDYPEDRRGIRAFFAAARSLGQSFARFGANMRASQTLTIAEKLRALYRMTAAGIPFMRYGGVSADKGLGRFFSGSIRDRMWRAEASLIACLMPLAWAYVGDFQRPPAGGSQRIASWLAGACAAAGVPIACRSRAEGVALDGSSATAVRYCGDGDRSVAGEIRCRHVVAACDARTLYLDLLPAGTVSRSFAGRLSRAETYDSAVSVFLGLGSAVDDLGIGEELMSITRGGIPRSAHTSADPERTEITVLAPSIPDPALAPAGKGSLILYTTARIDDNDRWKTGPGLERGQAYYAFKQRYADVLIDRVERELDVELRSRIEVCEVATPVTYARYTGSRDGAIMGFRPTFANLRAGYAKRVTPVKNLLLGGQWAGVGGGLPAAVQAGANAAAIILKTERPRAFAVLRDAMDGRVGA